MFWLSNSTHVHTKLFSNGCSELPFSKIERQNTVKIFLIELVCLKIQVFQVRSLFLICDIAPSFGVNLKILMALIALFTVFLFLQSKV